MPIVHRRLPADVPSSVLVAAGIDESRQPVPAQDAGRDFDGEALRDAAEVDLDARPRETNRVLLTIEHHVAVVDERPHRREFRGARQVRLLVVKPPQPDERAHGDVERAVGSRADLLRGIEHAKQWSADVHRSVRRRSVDEAQLAVVAVVAHQPIDFGDGAERFVDRSCACGCVAAEGFDFDRGAHHVAVFAGRSGARLRGCAAP